MALDSRIQHMEREAGYGFASKALLLETFIAAGAEETNYDGNRRLSQLGAVLTDFLFAYAGFKAHTTRGIVHKYLDHPALY